MTSLCRSVAACDSGHWGPDCSSACNCSVGHGGCDAVSGLCVCEAGYVGLWCEQRESRPGLHTHAHMHAHMHTHTCSRAYTRTSVRETQPCFLSTDKQGVSLSKPTPTSPSGPPAICHTPTAWAQEKAHEEQRQQEMGSVAPQGAPATRGRGGKCLLRTRGPACSVDAHPGRAGGSG